MLNKTEHNELLKLTAKCMDPKSGFEKPLPDADKKDLKRMQELLAKMEAEPEDQTGRPRPMKIRNFTMSEKGKLLVSDGATFQGVEVRNHGNDQHPVLVYREWFYVGERDQPNRKAIFVQYQEGHSGDAKVIEAGRTIAASAFQRLQK